ncbi:uncharacterized protein LOC132059566 isoform X1 [Lycium ferocissimum]|uniref:uncharacterized protein LOC132059566 isoform X1 n=1 Tax=Lycium ferocissimum TaxID=112874 RepID=UPI00281577FF|nr:uncharacterized protein LOC132059566 isoform X1 [Lycium ferocissimum]
MAYIPPHKRQTKGSPLLNPTPTPDFLNVKSSFGEQSRKKNHFRGKNIVYRRFAILKWFSVGVANDSLFSSLVRLQPVCTEYFERYSGQTPLALVLMEGVCKETNELIDAPWLVVSEKVKPDILLSFQHMKSEMEEADMAQVKPSVVARFGKVLFYGNSSICEESLETKPPMNETTVRKMERNFYTNIPAAYMDYIENQVVEKLGLEYVQGKELYNVALSDMLQPDSTVSCKCTVAKDHNKIELYKIESNRVRHMVADMSCLGKSSDLRLILYTKKIKMILSDEEINEIKDLIGSAILDSEVQGGLRWPLSKDSSSGRYAAIGIGHTTSKSYRNSSIRFKLRHADRFDLRSSTGEVTREIFLKMPGIVSQLRKQTVEENLVFEMLENNLKLIWEHCLLDGSSS